MPWAMSFCPFRAYWVISTVQIEPLWIFNPLKNGVRSAISLSNVNYPYLPKTETKRGKNQCFLVSFRRKDAKYEG